MITMNEIISNHHNKNPTKNADAEECLWNEEAGPEFWDAPRLRVGMTFYNDLVDVEHGTSIITASCGSDSGSHHRFSSSAAAPSSWPVVERRLGNAVEYHALLGIGNTGEDGDNVASG